jgi:hypothetical protein
VSRKSKRFVPNTLSEKVVPLILALLLLGLAATLAIVILSALGLTPGF